MVTATKTSEIQSFDRFLQVLCREPLVFSLTTYGAFEVRLNPSDQSVDLIENHFLVVLGRKIVRCVSSFFTECTALWKRTWGIEVVSPKKDSGLDEKLTGLFAYFSSSFEKYLDSDYTKMSPLMRSSLHHLLETASQLNLKYLEQVVRYAKTENTKGLGDRLIRQWDCTLLPESLKRLHSLNSFIHGTRLPIPQPIISPSLLEEGAQSGIEQGRLFSGKMPILGSLNHSEAQSLYAKRLTRDGITDVVLLVEDEELMTPGLNIFDFYRKAHMTVWRFPIEDGGVPDDPKWLERIFQGLKETLSESMSRKFYVHCLAGKGRTGTFLACFLMYLHPSLVPERAISDVRAQIPGAIESEGQECFIQEFYAYLKSKQDAQTGEGSPMRSSRHTWDSYGLGFLNVSTFQRFSGPPTPSLLESPVLVHGD